MEMGTKQIKRRSAAMAFPSVIILTRDYWKAFYRAIYGYRENSSPLPQANVIIGRKTKAETLLLNHHNFNF